MAKFRVLQDFGKHRVGHIVDDSDIYIWRKTREDGCLEAIEEKSISNYENKMIEPENNKKAKKEGKE
jgi:hypothetical protein